MAATVYVRQLPNLNRNTRAAAYARLGVLLEHLDALGVDLLSVVVDTVALTVTITLSNPVTDVDQRQHLWLE